MRRIALLLILLLVPVSILAQSSQVPPTTEYTLPNGLKLIVRENHRAPVVLCSVWYKVGASYEPDGFTGISHLLEHMMFEGTKKYGPGQIDKIISENGGEQNAMTMHDATVYYERLAADKLPLCFDIESDRMQDLDMSPARFEKEKKVVMEERRLRIDDNPMSMAWVRFNAAAYINSPYHHPVAGWMTDIQNLELNDLKHWYETWYAPNNAIVIVVGDVKPDYVYALAKKYFGPLKSRSIPKLKPRIEVPALGSRRVILHLPAKVRWLALGFNTPSLVTADKKWQPYALEVLAYILSGSNSSRLEKDLVRNQEVAVSVGSDYGLLHLHGSLFVLYGIPSVGHSIGDLESAFLAEVNKVRTTLVDPEELERVKAQLTASNVYQRDSLMEQAFNIGMPEMVGLTWQEGDRYIQNISAVTPEQVREVAREYLKPELLTKAILRPKSMPSQGGDQ